MKFGVQLYSLREYIKEHGVEEALRIVAEAGFDGVEFAGFYGKSVGEIEALLARYRLQAVSAHVGAEEIGEQLPYLKALNVGCAVIPWLDFNGSLAYGDGLNVLRGAQEKLRQNGIALGYHNHSHEFRGGKDIVSDLARDLPELKLEPDVFWLAVAGIDAVSYLKKHRDRLVYLHIKELGEGGAEGENPVLGEGKANLGEALTLGKEFYLAWSVLEFERTSLPAETYLKRSFAFMENYR